ncbi:hypothetical protein ABZ330_25500 [Streptomyces sp. NPDC006172]|uniref:hypothetical protein n=1 Tax=Streptomyces sp. NPDC006172 TaxID=3154470 RepID=UPI0033D2DD31
MSTATTRPEKRLEGGWFQRLAWSALVWLSLGLLAWVPFLYVAIRRGRPSDWGALAAFVLYEVVTIPWLSHTNDRPTGDPFLGIALFVTWVTATCMLLFAVFDPKAPAYPAAGPAYPYQPGTPYGR